METMTIDSKTVIVKTDNEDDLPEIIGLINQKNRKEIIKSFLSFASKNRIEEKNFKFNREDCYDR